MWEKMWIVALMCACAEGFVFNERVWETRQKAVDGLEALRKVGLFAKGIAALTYTEYTTQCQENTEVYLNAGCTENSMCGKVCSNTSYSTQETCELYRPGQPNHHWEDDDGRCCEGGEARCGLDDSGRDLQYGCCVHCVQASPRYDPFLARNCEFDTVIGAVVCGTSGGGCGRCEGTDDDERKSCECTDDDEDNCHSGSCSHSDSDGWSFHNRNDCLESNASAVWTPGTWTDLSGTYPTRSACEADDECITCEHYDSTPITSFDWGDDFHMDSAASCGSVLGKCINDTTATPYDGPRHCETTEEGCGPVEVCDPSCHTWMIPMRQGECDEIAGATWRPAIAKTVTEATDEDMCEKLGDSSRYRWIQPRKFDKGNPLPASPIPYDGGNGGRWLKGCDTGPHHSMDGLVRNSSGEDSDSDSDDGEESKVCVQPDQFFADVDDDLSPSAAVDRNTNYYSTENGARSVMLFRPIVTNAAGVTERAEVDFTSTNCLTSMIEPKNSGSIKFNGGPNSVFLVQDVENSVDADPIIVTGGQFFVLEGANDGNISLSTPEDVFLVDLTNTGNVWMSNSQNIHMAAITNNAGAAVEMEDVAGTMHDIVNHGNVLFKASTSHRKSHHKDPQAGGFKIFDVINEGHVDVRGGTHEMYNVMSTSASSVTVTNAEVTMDNVNNAGTVTVNGGTFSGTRVRNTGTVDIQSGVIDMEVDFNTGTFTLGDAVTGTLKWPESASESAPTPPAGVDVENFTPSTLGSWTRSAATDCATECGQDEGSGTPGAVTCSTGLDMDCMEQKPDALMCAATDTCASSDSGKLSAQVVLWSAAAAAAVWQF